LNKGTKGWEIRTSQELYYIPDPISGIKMRSLRCLVGLVMLSQQPIEKFFKCTSRDGSRVGTHNIQVIGDIKSRQLTIGGKIQKWKRTGVCSKQFLKDLKPMILPFHCF
jgi:hypothetical protein